MELLSSIINDIPSFLFWRHCFDRVFYVLLDLEFYGTCELIPLLLAELFPLCWCNSLLYILFSFEILHEYVFIF